jgi:hypothetical protein
MTTFIFLLILKILKVVIGRRKTCAKILLAHLVLFTYFVGEALN